MSKPKREQNTQTAQGDPVVAKAEARFLRSTARKVRLVANQVRNKTVAEAIEILRFLHRPSGTPFVLRAVLSAAKNAENVHPEPETLRIAEIQVNGGPMMKRIHARAMGRACRVRKRLCHIRIFLAE